MPIRYRCGGCNQLISIATRMAGKVVSCPKCEQATQVPEPEVAPPQESDQDESFGSAKRHCEFGELDLTPMVDVVMLLLIFFIITANMIAQKTLQTPQKKNDGKGGASAAVELDVDDLEDASIVVQVNERNAYIVDDAPVTAAQLIAKLRERRTRDRSDVLIDAHPDATHDAVVQVIDAANEIGIQKIRLKSKEEAD
ncbi:MAG: biopolymer transporter ExbD [Planctomycetales bacterium]|jgi:biopolymer transport protein ExbD|nr:biopolymer transporter ExbD [Planctomycetales bacterium]